MSNQDDGNGPEMGPPPPGTVKAIIDPNHPHAGARGVVPPEAYRFKPGVRPPCGGGKKGMVRLTDKIRTKLEEKTSRGDETVGEGIVRTLLEMAQAKDLGAIREILDRVDGKALQRVEAVIEAKRNEELAFATDEELETLEVIMTRCRERAAAKGIMIGVEDQAPE